jgi:hypothetical protein
MSSFPAAVSFVLDRLRGFGTWVSVLRIVVDCGDGPEAGLAPP